MCVLFENGQEGKFYKHIYSVEITDLLINLTNNICNNNPGKEISEYK